MDELPRLRCLQCKTALDALPGGGVCSTCGTRLFDAAVSDELMAQWMGWQASIAAIDQSPARARAAIQPLLAALPPYAATSPALAAYLKAWQQQATRWTHAHERLRLQGMIHWALLAVLAAAPLMAGMLRAGTMLVVLLSLPVAGWFYLGIWNYYRRSGLF